MLLSAKLSLASREYTDPEFGTVHVRRVRRARYVKLRIDSQGLVRISLPFYAPVYAARQLLEQSRDHIRRVKSTIATERTILSHGDLIGKTHRLLIVQGDTWQSRIIGTDLCITLPIEVAAASEPAQHFIKQAATKALRTQAKAYLSRRLQMLAETHGFTFANLRFSNASTRWGSCSSKGTISLNIWLMQLPFELIDYVLVHELCHTKHMNHSPAFWALVGSIHPNYRELKKTLKSQHPYV